MKNYAKQSVLYLLLLMSQQAWAQADDFSPKIFEQMKAKHPSKMAVYLKLYRVVNLDLVGDSIVATTEDYYDLLHLNELSKTLAKDQVYSSSFKENISIEAQTLVPNKNKYKSIPVTTFKEKSEISEGIFYDDYKATAFVYPAVEPGVRTTLRDKKLIKDAHFLTAFYFGAFVPVEEAHLTIIAHQDIQIKHKIFNEEALQLQYTQTQKGKYITYSWAAKNLKMYEMESQAPKSSYFLPHIAYYVASYQANGKNIRVLSDVGDLYNWYSGFIGKMKHQDDPQLNELVGQLVKDAKTEEERVRRIFYWVQDNIKYIAFEDGLRGFVPHSPTYVFGKRYGDCKDMATLTNKMLNLAGVTSYLTWIGSRDLPYRYDELPTPMVDNHMIVTYKMNNQLYFLDATSSNTYLGLPSSMIQGKEALLDLGNGQFEVAKVPVIDKEVNAFADTVWVSLADKNVLGKGKVSMKGYSRAFNAYRITGRKDEEEKQYISALLRKGSNKCFIEDYAISGLDNKDKPLEINYQFRVEDYSKRAGDEMYINLNLDKSFANETIDTTDRELPLENDYQYADKEVVMLEVPEGYTVSYLPNSTSFRHELFGFNITYKQKGNKVMQEREIYLNYLLLKKQNFSDWNRMVKALTEAYREVVILKRA